MALRCPCGSENPEDSTYCNKCGRRIELERGGVKTCQSCSHVNPSHVEYCGRCGADLGQGFGKNVVAEKDSPPSLLPPEAYLASGDHPLVSGRTYITKGQFFVNLIISAVFIIVFGIIFLLEGGPMAGLAWCAFAIAVMYISWRLGRGRAGWGG